jgi:hypothetical protein
VRIGAARSSATLTSSAVPTWARAARVPRRAHRRSTVERGAHVGRSRGVFLDRRIGAARSSAAPTWAGAATCSWRGVAGAGVERAGARHRVRRPRGHKQRRVARRGAPARRGRARRWRQARRSCGHEQRCILRRMRRGRVHRSRRARRAHCGRVHRYVERGARVACGVHVGPSSDVLLDERVGSAWSSAPLASNAGPT